MLGLAKPFAEEEMRCGLSFRGSHLTHHSTDSSSTPPTYLYCCCVLCLFICLTGFQTWTFLPEEAAVMKRLERWQLLSFTLHYSAAERASRRSFRQLHLLTITINASEWTFLWRKPPLWVLTQQDIRKLNITLTNSTGSQEVQQDRHFQPDWVFMLGKRNELFISQLDCLLEYTPNVFAYLGVCMALCACVSVCVKGEKLSQGK